MEPRTNITKKNESTENSLQNQALGSFLTKENFHFFLRKKVEKISAAVYLVTTYSAEEEPMRWTLRRNGIELLEHVLSFTVEPIVPGTALEKVFASMAKMVSFLEVSFGAGLVSEMNFVLLKNELEILARNLETKAGLKNRGLFLNEHFFNLSSEKSHGQSGYSASGGFNRLGNEAVLRDRRSAGGGPYKGHRFIKDTKNVLDKNVSGLRKNKRQEEILSLLNNGQHLTIKDFAAVIKDCSVKTVQRELVSLVLSGVLKREGERRWSRYYLSA